MSRNSFELVQFSWSLFLLLMFTYTIELYIVKQVLLTSGVSWHSAVSSILLMKTCEYCEIVQLKQNSVTFKRLQCCALSTMFSWSQRLCMIVHFQTTFADFCNTMLLHFAIHIYLISTILHYWKLLQFSLLTDAEVIKFIAMVQFYVDVFAQVCPFLQLDV